MTLASRVTKRLGEMDFFDYLYMAQTAWARIKARCFYACLFASVGKRSWVKKPALIFGASRITLGDRVRIEKGVTLYAVRRYGRDAHTGFISVGSGTFINQNCNLTSAAGIAIGEQVTFGPNVFITDFDHGYAEPGVDRIASQLVIKGPVTIGARCWLGANVCIASGVELGADCVVGANSVVTRSFPAGTLIAGSPARALKRYDAAVGQWVRCPSGDGSAVGTIVDKNSQSSEQQA